MSASESVIVSRIIPWTSATEADWDALYAEQLPRVYNFLRYRVGDGPDAEDLTSETFERAWRREIGAELRDSVLVQRFLFRNPRRIDEMVKGARIYRDLAQTVIRYAIGRQSYGAARRMLLWRFPGLVLRLLFEIPRADTTRHTRGVEPKS